MVEYRFAPFVLDPLRAVLTIHGQPVEIRQKTSRLLECFLRSSGELLSKDQLLDDVWSEVTVGEAVVFQTISELRKLLSRVDSASTFIQTVKGEGYRWVYPEPVQVVALETPELSSEDAGSPTTWWPAALRRAVARLRVSWAVATAVLMLIFVLGVLLGSEAGTGSAAEPHADAIEARSVDAVRLLILADRSPDESVFVSGGAQRGLLRLVELVLDSTEGLDLVTAGPADQWFFDVAEDLGTKAEASKHFSGFLGVGYVVFADLESSGEAFNLEMAVYSQETRITLEEIRDVSLLHAAEQLGQRITERLGLPAPSRHVAGSFSNDVNALDAFALGEAARDKGEVEAAARLFEKSLSHDAEFLWAKVALAKAYENQGRINEAEALVHAVLAEARTAQDYHLEVECLQRLASEAIRAGAWLDLQDYQRRILKIAWREGNRRIEASALRMQGTYYGHQNQWDKAKASYAASLHVANEVGDHLAQAHAYNNLGTVALEQDDLESAREAFQEALERYARIGNRRFEVGPIANLALVEKSLGHLDAAETLLLRSLDLADSQGNPVFKVRILGSLGVLLSEQERLAEATERLQEALDLSDQVRDSASAAAIAFNLASVHMKSDRFDEIPALLRRCEDQWGARHPNVLILRGRFHHALDELTVAHEYLVDAKALLGAEWDPSLDALLGNST